MGEQDFTTFDINAVPPELRKHVEKAYKQLQDDYIRKCQEDSQTRREAELRVQELELKTRDLQTALLDYRTANEAWVNWSKTLSAAQPADNNESLDMSEDEGVMETREIYIRRIVIIIAMAIFSLMAVFPPWEVCADKTKAFAGYSLIFISPKWGAGIAIGHLLVQWFVVSVVTAVILCLLKKDLLRKLC